MLSDENLKAIDFHVHMTSPYIASNAGKIGEREPYFKLLSDSPKNKFAAGEQIIEEMNRTGVEKSVVFGFSFNDPLLCREANDYTIEIVRKYKDRFIGFMCVSPTAKGLESEIDRCVGGGLVGVGEIFPDGQGLQIDDNSATSYFAGLLEERSLPVIIHSNEPVGHYYAGKTDATPVRVAKFCEHHPNVKTVFAHWGGGLPFYELMPEMRRILKNAYYDFSASPYLYKPEIFNAAKELGILDKLLFGSDFPLLSPARYFKQLGETKLTAEDKQKILYSNAQNLLNL